MKILKSIHGEKAFVDNKHFSFLNQFRWALSSKGYFKCLNTGSWNSWEIYGQCLHWFVIKLLSHEIPSGFMVDHANRNPLNNQRLNLRLVTNQMNCCNAKIPSTNTTGVIGVYWIERNHNWAASIRINGKNKHLGSYTSKEDATKVRLATDQKRNLDLFGHKNPMINVTPLEDFGPPALDVIFRTKRDKPLGCCGFRGVSNSRSHKNPFRANIRINGKTKNLGCFKTPQEASDAYELALSEILT